MPRTTTTTKPTTTTKTATTAKTAKAASNGNTGPSAAEKLRTALHRHPESTARELADLAGIGVSTATKLLAAWAADGQTVRIPGEDTGGRKPAARWAPPQPAEDTTTTTRATGSPRRKKAPDATADDADDAATTTTAPAPSVTDEPPTGRLPKGALHGLVEDFLAEPQRRGNAYTPGEVGRKLNRSQGAVCNALDKLAERGTVTLVQTGPRRYQIADDN